MGSVISAIKSTGFPFTGPYHSSAWHSQINLTLENKYANFLLKLEDTPLDYDSEEFLAEGKKLLEDFRLYKNCMPLIQSALNDSSSENEYNVWKALSQNIRFLERAYHFSFNLETEIASLLTPLLIMNASETQGSSLAQNIQQPRVELYFTKIMQIVLKFDMIKMNTLSLQNEFSYYRRTLSKMKKSQDPEILSSVLEDDTVNHMSFFYAYPNPMFKTVIKAATQFTEQNNSSSFLELLAALKISSINLLKSSVDKDLNSRILTLMTVCCVLYDWTDPEGVYVSTSIIDVTSVVQAIRRHAGLDETFYMDFFRINSKTLRNPMIPRKVKSMMGF